MNPVNEHQRCAGSGRRRIDSHKPDGGGRIACRLRVTWDVEKDRDGAGGQDSDNGLRQELMHSWCWILRISGTVSNFLSSIQSQDLARDLGRGHGAVVLAA